jgi:hypothetical protein
MQPVSKSVMSRESTSRSNKSRRSATSPFLADTVVLRTNERKNLKLGHDDSKNVPALKIGRLACDLDAKKRFQGIGKTLMWLAYQNGVATRQTIGCRLLTVDAYAGVVDYYAKLGFVANKTRPDGALCGGCGKPLEPPNGSPANDTTVSMRFDLKSDPLPDWATKTLVRAISDGL